MDDFLEQVARRRRQGLYTFLYFVMWFLLIIFGLYALICLMQVVGVDDTGLSIDFLALIEAVVFGGLAVLLWRRSDYCRLEYDYSFTNGTLDISQVLNNKRRRYLTALEMKEVIRCGPAKGPGFQKTLNEKDVKKHNWFVNRDAKLYYFYFEKKGVKHLAVVELSDEMIEIIRGKKNYLQRGAWVDENGNSSYGILS